MSSDASGAVKLCSDDAEPAAPQLVTEDELLVGLDVADFFETDRTVAWIKQGGFARVALQLPDSFLRHAFSLASRLEAQTGAKTFVLADTAYRNCCADFVAAQHANCDALVHYGEACLSASTGQLPVLYVFGRFPLDVRDLADKLHSALADSAGPAPFLLYDSVFAHAAEDVRKALGEVGLEVVMLDMKPAGCKPSKAGPTPERLSLGRVVPTELAGGRCPPDSCLIFVGSEESALLPLWLMSFPGVEQVVLYNPRSGQCSSERASQQRQLRKRLFLVEKVRDAHILGLVVGSMGVAGYAEAIQRMRALCRAARKKLYVLSIGKLNEAKLSNFSSDIDAFVLLSCPFGVVLDSAAFFRPIVSLFEAEVALNAASADWCAADGWTAEFQGLLQRSVEAADGEQADVSLVSGQIRGVQPAATAEEAEQDGRLAPYSAGDYFANRSWKGLDDECAESSDLLLTLQPGLSGVPVAYASEKE